MSPPGETVNDLMRYLRDTCRLNAPVLPVAGMSAALARLWTMLVSWIPTPPPPRSSIAVIDQWDIMLPTGRTFGMRQVEVILVLETGSPTLH